MGLLGRIAELRRRRRRFPVDAIHEIGRSSEAYLEALVRHVAEPKGWFVATNRRVLNPETRRRREVDLILIHERRWMIIEQKHWSGRVEVLDDGRFIQHRPKGGRQDHGAIAETIDMKAGLIASGHHDRTGSLLEAPEVAVVFSHPRMELEVHAHQTASAIWRTSDLIDRLEASDDGVANPELVETIERCSMWEEVHLHGGQQVNGDVLDIGEVGALRDWVRNLSRSDGTIVVDVPRRWWHPFSGDFSITARAEDMEVSIPDRANLRMHVVGEAEPRSIEWRHIERVVLSRRHVS